MTGSGRFDSAAPLQRPARGVIIQIAGHNRGTPTMSDTINTTTGIDYDFIAADDDSDDGFGLPPMGERWGVGSHSTVTEDDVNLTDAISAADPEIDDQLLGVLQEAESLVSTDAINEFECPVCGLSHSHSDTKHDVREAFGVTDEAASQLEYVPYCHCGVNELSAIMPFFPAFERSLFEDEFSAVRQLSFEAVNELYEQWSSGTRLTTALQRSNISRAEGGVVMDNIPEFDRFFELRSDIESAADGAPIPGDARRDIDAIRGDMDATLGDSV